MEASKFEFILMEDDLSVLYIIKTGRL